MDRRIRDVLRLIRSRMQAEFDTRSKVLLIDAGAKYRHYACDLTRTHIRGTAHPVFRSLAPVVETMMLELTDACTVGAAWIDLQKDAESRVLDALIEHDVLRGDREQMEELKVAKLFFPHGLGHNLGLQVLLGERALQ